MHKFQSVVASEPQTTTRTADLVIVVAKKSGVIVLSLRVDCAKQFIFRDICLRHPNHRAAR